MEANTCCKELTWQHFHVSVSVLWLVNWKDTNVPSGTIMEGSFHFLRKVYKHNFNVVDRQSIVVDCCSYVITVNNYLILSLQGCLPTPFKNDPQPLVLISEVPGSHLCHPALIGLQDCIMDEDVLRLCEERWMWLNRD